MKGSNYYPDPESKPLTAISSFSISYRSHRNKIAGHMRTRAFAENVRGIYNLSSGHNEGREKRP
jgi:hypothetical protein